MIVARTRSALFDALAEVDRQGGRLALVPTMGALHAGHLALVRRARSVADRTALSIFVNPTQFGPGEDLERYPRPLESDLETAEAQAVDLVFAPEAEAVVYPEGDPRITVDPGPMADRLCGAHRPGHFRGVLTVVAKLFGLVRPDVAVFGRKDFQQAALVRRMIRDLELGVQLETVPVVREEDGLALSSRNAYLSRAEREQAVGLHRGLGAARQAFAAGEADPEALRDAFRAELERRPLLELQYAEIVDPETLEAPERAREASVLAVAAHCGHTRLIDNAPLGGTWE